MSGLTILIYGLPAFFASMPGLWALATQRKILGWILIAGAVAVTIPFALFLDRTRTMAMTEDGLVADDWAVSFVLPPLLGLLYLIVATIVCVVWAFSVRRGNGAARFPDALARSGIQE